MGGFSGDGVDTLGHGTAVAAAVCDLASGAWIHSIGVLDAEGRCDPNAMVGAIDDAIATGAHLINLSLGVGAADLEADFKAVISRVQAAGARLIAPAAQDGIWCYPGCMVGVDGVVVEAVANREEPTRREYEGLNLWFASPFPRDLPGLDRDRNLQGVSMAVANVTGFLAHSLQPQ